MKLNSIAILSVLLMPPVVLGQDNGPKSSEPCWIITAADLSDSKAPSFGDYPAANTQDMGSTPKLDLTTNTIAKTYRTVLRQEVPKGPNYDGHYRVAVWGCGASCAMFAVVNLRTGRVITAREFATVVGAHLVADDFLPGTRTGYWGFRYKNNSSLLVILGAPDEDESRTGAYYFALQSDRLHLIHTTRVRKNCEDAKP
jgi:hypothetical protein